MVVGGFLHQLGPTESMLERNRRRAALPMLRWTLACFVASLCVPSTFGQGREERISTRYGVVLDGGSSGTRVNVYGWTHSDAMSTEERLRSLREVAFRKISPGVSSFSDLAMACATSRSGGLSEEAPSPPVKVMQPVLKALKCIHGSWRKLVWRVQRTLKALRGMRASVTSPVVNSTPTEEGTGVPSQQLVEAVAEYLEPLLAHAVAELESVVSVSGEVSDTPRTLPVVFYATAGLRLVPAAVRDAIIAAVREVLVGDGRLEVLGFVPEVTVEAISGDEEARLSWIAANRGAAEPRTKEELAALYGVIELGGASTQIVYAAERLSLEENGTGEQYTHVRASHLGFGALEAFDRAVEACEASERERSGMEVPCPCLYANHTIVQSGTSRTVVGTGEYDACESIADSIVRPMVESEMAKQTWKAAPPANGVPFIAYDFFETAVDAAVDKYEGAQSGNGADQVQVRREEYFGEAVLAPTLREIREGGRLLCAMEHGEAVNWLTVTKMLRKLKADRLCFGAAYSVSLMKAYGFVGDDASSNEGMEEGNARVLFSDTLGGFKGGWATGAIMERM